jgi:type I restriction enzyme R subunit
VPFEVDTFTTEFLREGIKYSQLSEEQRRQLREDEELPETIEFEQPNVDKYIYNKDTNRHILRNLMDNGIRVAEGSRIGKTIVFARSMRHARLLEQLINEMYPQYGGNFCQVIVSDDPRAESLIDDFKGEGNNPELTIAISVDMLDTGVDIPEVVNLVFAKPIYSYVKFWQMIGRGTRLCEDLFGPGRDKTHFQIFDHWGNFQRWEEDYKPAEPSRRKSLAETVFLARLSLASTAIDKQDADSFDLAVDLIGKDIAALPTGSVAVRDKWRQVHGVSREETLREFSAATRATLEHDVAPLMQWIDITRYEEAWKFDRLIAHLKTELLRSSSRFDDLRDEVVDLVSRLRINLSQVRVKQETIQRVQTDEFWEEVTVAALEAVRNELRGIIQYRQRDDIARADPKIVDIAEDQELIERSKHKVRLDKLDDLDMHAYRNRVTNVLQTVIDQSETLQKIRRGEPVDEQDLEELCSLVLTQEPGLDLHDLEEYYQHVKPLDQAIREIIGMDAEAVHERFEAFIHAHPEISSHANKFLQLLQRHIATHGSIEIEQLYEPPFTTLHSDGIDGLFEGALADELQDIIRTFQPQAD